MAIGLKIPIGPNPSGGFSLVDGDENDIKIIKATLTDTDNENAWQQDESLGEDIIFEFSDPLTISRINRRLKDIFEKFEDEKRFKLVANTILWEEIEDNNQEMILSFKYLNMESDEEKSFTSKFGPSSFGG